MGMSWYVDATSHPLVMILWHLGTNFGGTPRMDIPIRIPQGLSTTFRSLIGWDQSPKHHVAKWTCRQQPALAPFFDRSPDAKTGDTPGVLTVNQPIWYVWEAMQTCSGQLQNSLEYLSAGSVDSRQSEAKQTASWLARDGVAIGWLLMIVLGVLNVALLLVNIRNANMNQQQFSVDSVSAPASLSSFLCDGFSFWCVSM